MKTRVEFTGKSQYSDWEIWDKGYIDGYVRGADERTYAIVVLEKDNTIVLCPNYQIKAIGFIK